MSDYHSMAYRILEAQKINLGRLQSGVTIGAEPVLEPVPELIRLDDTPLRLMSAGAQKEKQVVFTLAMLKDGAAQGRIARRDERDVSYGIHAYVRLTEAETKQEQAEDGLDIMAHKLDACLTNIKLVFNDDPGLITDECPQGLVDHGRITDVMWDRTVQYPVGGLICVCLAQTYER